jgi:hypothetical protein
MQASGDGRGDASVDFHIERVELAFALAQRVQQGAGAGGDSLGCCSGRFLGQAASFHRAPHEVLVSGLGAGTVDSGGAHEDFPPAQSWAERAALRL